MFRWILFLLWGSLLLASVAGAETETSHPTGVWGLPAACERYEAGLEPRPETFWYEIGDQWMERFLFVCFFGAAPPQQIAPDRWLTLMTCGEDGMRSWYVTLVEEPDDGLSLIWQLPGDDDSYRVGPLQACALSE